jgi:hypothetical protein
MPALSMSACRCFLETHTPTQCKPTDTHRHAPTRCLKPFTGNGSRGAGVSACVGSYRGNQATDTHRYGNRHGNGHKAERIGQQLYGPHTLGATAHPPSCTPSATSKHTRCTQEHPGHPRTRKAGWPAIWLGNGCKDPCRAACARGRNPDRGYPTFVAQFELGNQASWVLYQESLANIGQGCCPGCCPSPRTGALGCPGGVSQHPETVPIMRGYRC